MGREDNHLHQFVINKESYGSPYDDDFGMVFLIPKFFQNTAQQPYLVYVPALGKRLYQSVG
jgi:hypothetical protein